MAIFQPVTSLHAKSPKKLRGSFKKFYTFHPCEQCTLQLSTVHSEIHGYFKWIGYKTLEQTKKSGMIGQELIRRGSVRYSLFIKLFLYFIELISSELLKRIVSRKFFHYIFSSTIWPMDSDSHSNIFPKTFAISPRFTKGRLSNHRKHC